MIVLRLIVLGVILWVIAKFQWGAITSGTPLPLAPVQVMLCAMALGVLMTQSAVLDLKRRLQRMQLMREEPKRPWLIWVVAALLCWMIFATFWGRVDFANLTLFPDPDHDLRKSLFGVIIFFVIGLFLHWRAREREMSDCRRQIRAVEAERARWNARQAVRHAQAREEAQSRSIAEELWGAAPEPKRGSVPEVVHVIPPRLLRSAATPDLSPKKSVEREIANSDWHLWSGERVLVNDMAVQIAFHYRDFAGVETDRTVLVRALIGKGHRTGELTITKFGGHCDLRGADREFEIARVMLASDPQTGEKIHVVGSWLAAHAGRSERVRPVETLLSAWGAVRPTSVVVGLDLTRGRGEAFETFTVTIDTVLQPGLAFEGLAVRHKTDKVPGWKGRKQFPVVPDGPIHLAWMTEADKNIVDIPVWLASLPAVTERNTGVP